MGRNETRNKGAGGQTGSVQPGQDEPHNTQGNRNADTHGIQVWEIADKEGCGLFGYVMLIQVAARDKGRHVHGKLCVSTARSQLHEGTDVIVLQHFLHLHDGRSLRLSRNMVFTEVQTHKNVQYGFT